MATRKRASGMTHTEQQRYIDTITQLNLSGFYGGFVAIHADMMHRMHSSMGPVGGQRFLSWHRLYLHKLEQAMQAIDSQAFIPYWRWTKDRAIPQWMLGFTPTVSVPSQGLITVARNPQPPAELPKQARITSILAHTTYTDFTTDLESRPHNRVHMWVNGTMSNIPTAPADPLFWMHHAMIDRIWSMWQAKPANSGKGPNLSGNDRILDPWTETVNQVQSISVLGYSYGPG
jgi:tyrosinase